jgi:transmembrane sensor
MKKNYPLAKWLNDELSGEELAEFQASADYEKYQKIKKYSSLLEVENFDEVSMLNQVLQQPKTTSKVIPLYKKWIIRVAAVLIIALGISSVMDYFIPEKQVAENGKKTSFSLPDQSEVVLNSGSEIEYKKWRWNTNRKIELKGEAYFKVAKGRRFEVITDLGKVAVLGTQFNVKARKNRLDVSCYEGRVKVNYKDKQLILTQGQSVIFENEEQLNSNTKVSKPEWTDNQIAFEKEKIHSILEEIERQYNISIELQSKNTNALFTGKLPIENLEIALQIICTTYHLKVEQISKDKIKLVEK